MVFFRDQKHLALRLLLAGAAVALAVLLVRHVEFFQELLARLMAAAESLIRRNELAGAAVFLVLTALSAMLAPLSSVPLAPVAVVLWGAPATFVLLLGGWLIGHSIAYLIGRYAGYMALKRFVDIGRIEYYRLRLSRSLGFGLVLAFRLAMPAEIPGYILGGLRYNFAKYALATVLAELPFAVVIAYASGAFVAKDFTLFASWAGLGFAVAVVLLLAFPKTRQRIIGRERSGSPSNVL